MSAIEKAARPTGLIIDRLPNRCIIRRGGRILDHILRIPMSKSNKDQLLRVDGKFAGLIAGGMAALLADPTKEAPLHQQLNNQDLPADTRLLFQAILAEVGFRRSKVV